jgi:hypothetical protein
MPTDSTGQPIQVGDRVRFRGKVYTIKAFEPASGRLRTATIHFNEEQHTAEVADEVSVDKVG